MNLEGSGVLVTGAGGQAGSALRLLLDGATFATRSELDVTDRTQVSAAVSRSDVVIHLAAATDVDFCEAHPEVARQVNDEGTRNICEAALRSGARVIYVSTDYVFDGSKQGEYDEHDLAMPINHYGRSKLAGEGQVLRSSRGLVVRTSWLLGSRDSFLWKILRAAESTRVVPVVCDQQGRPTFADDLAVALIWLINNEASGVLHLAGDGESCSWADLAEIAMRSSRSPGRVERITTAEYAARTERIIAPRPLNSTLSLRSARKIGAPLADWRQSLDRCLKESAWSV